MQYSQLFKLPAYVLCELFKPHEKYYDEIHRIARGTSEKKPNWSKAASHNVAYLSIIGYTTKTISPQEAREELDLQYPLRKNYPTDRQLSRVLKIFACSTLAFGALFLPRVISIPIGIVWAALNYHEFAKRY